MEENQKLPRGKKFCKHCGEIIDKECIVCPKCGKQVEEISQKEPSVVINNTNSANAYAEAVSGVQQQGKPKNKWIAFLLCLFLGFLGAHKFYEGKTLMGVIYIFTVGLLGIGIIVDLVKILLKPNPYYV